MRKGPRVGGVKHAPLGVRVADARPKRATLSVADRGGGGDRAIRKICDHLRLRIGRIARTRLGPFSLAALPDRGAVRRVPVPRGVRRYVAAQRKV